MVTLLRRYDGVVWLNATIYEHCSGLCYLLFFSRHPGAGRGPLPRRDRHHYPVHCVDTPSPAKGNLIESTSCHSERSAAIHKTTPRPAELLNSVGGAWSGT